MWFPLGLTQLNEHWFLCGRFALRGFRKRQTVRSCVKLSGTEVWSMRFTVNISLFWSTSIQTSRKSYDLQQTQIRLRLSGPPRDASLENPQDHYRNASIMCVSYDSSWTSAWSNKERTTCTSTVEREGSGALQTNCTLFHCLEFHARFPVEVC